MANPTISARVDWDNNGNYSGTYDDISADITSLTWHRGAADWAGGTETGGAVLRVRNADGKYNPDNSGGNLYGKLLPGRPVHLTATYGGTTYGLFGGYIDRVVPIAWGAQREAELVCVDAIPRWQRRRVQLDPATDDTLDVKGVRDSILTDLGAGSYTTPAVEESFALVRQAQAYRDAVGMLEDLNRAVGSRHVIRPKATATGSQGWEYFCVARDHNRSAAVAATIDTIVAVNGYEVTGENVVNAPNVAYTPIVAGVEGEAVEVSSTDSASITAYGEQSGGTILSAFLHTEAMAKGLADHLLWRFKDPRKRPSVDLVDVFPGMLARELFDVVALTIPPLSVSARRFEIVGIEGNARAAHDWTVRLILQEMTEQSPLTDWFLLGTSVLGGAAVMPY